MLSLTSDYRISTGNPQPYLRAMAAAGFTHVHWCHQWNTDFRYAGAEIRQLGHWLAEYGLTMLDVHGSAGVEQCWFAEREDARLAGVELVNNRLELARALGAGALIMHIPPPDGAPIRTTQAAQLYRSLDSLLPRAQRLGVRLALENMANDDFALLTELFARYTPSTLGLCYDAGHGNIGRNGLALLDTVKDRLVCVHLHDNDGHGDQHAIPFTGTVDWPRLAGILARSSYDRCLSLETVIGDGKDEPAWLRQAHAAGTRLTHLVAQAKVTGNANLPIRE